MELPLNDVELVCDCSIHHSNSVDNPHYFILPSPVASPAKCGLCGYGGADRKYLDPRLDFEFWGSLIFCEMCVGTMANDFGFLQPAQSRALKSRLLEVESEVITLRAALLHLQEFSNVIGNLAPLVDIINPPDLSYDEPVSAEKISSLSVGSSSISNTIEQGGNSEIDEHFEQQGSDDLLRLAAELNAGNLDI